MNLNEVLSLIFQATIAIATVVAVVYGIRQYMIHKSAHDKNKVKGIKLIESEARSLDGRFKNLQEQLNKDECYIENFDLLLSGCGVDAWNKYKFDLLERNELNIHQIQRLERFYKQCCEVDDLIKRCRTFADYTRQDEYSAISKQTIIANEGKKSNKQRITTWQYSRIECAHDDYVQRLKNIVSEREEISSILDDVSKLN